MEITMDGDHLSPRGASALIRGSLDRRERLVVVRHLLAGCRRCIGELDQAIEREEREVQPVVDGAYREPIERVARLGGEVRERTIELAVERLVAPGLVALLVQEPFEEQRRRIAAEARFQTWGLCERLMDESMAATWATHPDQMLDLARASVTVSEHLPERYGRGRIHDLAAQAWGCLGNAHRIRAEFDQALEAFDRAHAHLEEGVGDLTTDVRLVSLRASLLIDQGYFEQAAELLDGAIALCREMSAAELTTVMVQKALALGYAGDSRPAIDLLLNVETILDRETAPRLFLSARHSRIWCLNDLGQTEEAMLLFDASRQLYEEFPDAWVRLRRSWLEARIAHRLGRSEEAEAILSALWTTAFTRGLELEVALISLDLSAVYVERGKFALAWQLASRMIPLFESWGVHRRVVEAWALLRHTFGAQTASVELVERISSYVARGWRNPEIPFQ
jgi:tetratricopeptide (TPR) repeat protein